MVGTLLYVAGSCERHSKFIKEMYIPFRPIPKEDVDFSINWTTNRNWQTRLLVRRKVTQLNILRQKSGKKLQIKLSISPSHSILPLGQSVPALTL